MRIKAFTKSKRSWIAFQCGLFIGIFGTFIKNTFIVFPIVYKSENTSIEQVPNTRRNMPTKDLFSQTEREKWQVQLEHMRRQLNQTDTVVRRERDALKAKLERVRSTLNQAHTATALRRERDNLQVEIQLLRSELNQTDTAFRRERESFQAQTSQARATLQKEWERRHEEVKRKNEELMKQQSLAGPPVDILDMQPILVTIAHQPRYDLLGSFVLPTLHLFAIAVWNGWALEILPFEGSHGEKHVKHLFELGHNISEGWGSGFIDASNRKDYDPLKLNAESYDNLGFFPKMPDPVPMDRGKWIDIESKSGIPKPGSELRETCKDRATPGNGFLWCRLWFPPNFPGADTHFLESYIVQNGGGDVFFDQSFRSTIRKRYWETNAYRLKYYGLPGDKEAQNKSTPFNVAVHVRRGDILDPDRWIDQSVYVTVARRICKAHAGAVDVHVFSSGKNRDGNWSALEKVGSNNECRSVAFHLDNDEFDTWAHMVAADAFVMSKSAFSVIPAILSAGEIHFPENYWGIRLSHWHRFREKDGAAVQSR